MNEEQIPHAPTRERMTSTTAMATQSIDQSSPTNHPQGGHVDHARPDRDLCGEQHDLKRKSCHHKSSKRENQAEDEEKKRETIT